MIFAPKNWNLKIAKKTKRGMLPYGKKCGILWLGGDDMASAEKKRTEGGYIDVYVYLYSPTESQAVVMRKEAEGYCIEHRYIPHFVIDVGERNGLKDLMYLGKVNKEYKKVIIYSFWNIGEDEKENVNILFTIGTRRFEIEGMDGYTFPEIVEYLRVRQTQLYNERLNARRLKKAKAGEYVNGNTPYGYKRGRDRKLILDDYESFIVRYIFFRKENGYGVKKIRTELNKRGFVTRRGTAWSEGSVRRILLNKDFYMGYIEQEGLPKMKGNQTPLLKENGKVDMNYINTKFRVEEEFKIAKKIMKNKKSPNKVVPYIEVKSYADIRSL